MTTSALRQIRNLLGLSGTILSLVFGESRCRAADGTWTNPNGGNWSSSGNWSGGVVADGPGSLANFNTLDLALAATVTLDSARTNGNLTFGDTDPNTPAGWLISNGGTAGNTLTLSNSAATPVITVNAINVLAGFDPTNDVVFGPVLTGGQGFIKRGSGTLTLTNANSFGSPVQLESGVVTIGNASALGSGNLAVNYNGGAVRVVPGLSPAFANTNNVVTTGSIISSNGNYDTFNGPWIGSGTMFVHSTGRLTPGNGSATAFAGFTGTINLSDSTGNETRINLGSGATPYNLSAVTLNTGTNAGRFDFRTTVAPATVRIGALLGGSGTRLDSSEQATGTSLTWEIGYLNTSTTFDGTIRNRNAAVDRVGHLTKVGTGTLTLSGNNSYTGVTTISNGVLALVGSSALSGATNVITVLNGATFDVSGLTNAPAWSLGTNQTLAGSGVVTGSVSVAGGTLSPGAAAGAIGTLSFSNNLSLIEGVTNQFDITSPGVNDLILVAADLGLTATANGVLIRVRPTGAFIPNGTYTLLKCGGNLTTAALVLDAPTQTGNFALGTNLITKEIFLQVSGVIGSANLTWRGDGAANNWDITTANWQSGGSASTYKPGDNVTFDNSGSNNVPVNLVTVVNPGSILVNATKDYVFGSTSLARITGSTGLLKTNNGRLTLTTDNDYSGDTIIAAGTVQLGDGVNLGGSLGVGNVTNNGVLIYNHADNQTNSIPIRGSGTLVQSGAGALTVSAGNSYTGGTTISNGTIILSGYQGLGTGVVRLSGGTLRTVGTGSATTGLSNDVSVVSGGALDYTGTGTFGSVVFGALSGNPGATLTVTHGSAGPDRLRLYASFTNNANLDLSGAGIALAPYASAGIQIFNGVISGPGQIVNRAGGGATYLNGDNTYSGGTTITTGSIGLGANSTSSGGSVVSGPLGIGPLILANEGASTGGSGTVFASGGSRTVANPVTYPTATNTFTFILGGSNNLTLSGPFTLSGSDASGNTNRTIQVDNTALSTLAAVIGDAGLVCGITKTGNGILALTATNTYSGPTLVGGGTLLVMGQNDVGAVSVTNGVLGGTGTILGPVTVAAGGTLAPGASVGKLTINNNLTLAGNVLIEIDRTLSTSNDLIVVSGVLTNAGTGTVTVSNLGPALTVGNRFVLFNKPVLNGSALTVSGAGAVWANNLQADGSITVSSLVAQQPSISNPTRLADGSVRFSFTGASGQSYRVWATTNVALTPITNTWTLLTNNVFTGGTDSFQDSQATNFPLRFYVLTVP